MTNFKFGTSKNAVMNNNEVIHTEPEIIPDTQAPILSN